MNAIKIKVLVKSQHVPPCPANLSAFQMSKRWILGYSICLSSKITGFSFSFFFLSDFLQVFVVHKLGLFLPWEVLEVACVFSCLLKAVHPWALEQACIHPWCNPVCFRLPRQLHLCLTEYVLINHPVGCERKYTCKSRRWCTWAQIAQRKACCWGK